MQNHVYSWYLGIEQPQKLLIGPKGHDCAEWRELDPVATPPEWWGNGFYMDAEARCVMNRHDLTRSFELKDKTGIHYSNINYEVPGHVTKRSDYVLKSV